MLKLLKNILDEKTIVISGKTLLEEKIKKMCSLKPHPAHYVDDVMLATQSNISTTVPRACPHLIVLL